MAYLERLRTKYAVELATEALVIEHTYPETYRALIDGKPVGELNLATRGPYATSVTVTMKRRGIATALYAAAEKDLGRRMIPSPLGLSVDGIAFWKARLSKLSPEEKQSLLAESLAIGIKAGVGNSALKRMLWLGYKEVS